MVMTRVEKMVLVYLYLFIFKDGASTAVKGVQRCKLACERSTLKNKKICFSPKVPIQPCRSKSDSAPSGAI